MADNKVQLTITAINNTKQAFQSVSGEMQRLSGVNASVVSSIKSHWLGLTATIASAMAAVYKALDIATLSARVETLGIVMGVVGRNAGYSQEEVAAFSEEVRKMGITTQESRESIIRMAQAHLDLTKASELARVAQDAAVIGNVNSSEALERMVYGIQSAQVEMLRTIGINVNFENAYARAAEQMGKTTEALTENEKAQIRMNAVLERGKDIQGAYEAAMETTGKQLTSLPRYIEEVKLKLGDMISPALGVVVSEFTESLKVLDRQLADMSRSGVSSEWAFELADSVRGAIAILVAFSMVLDKVGGTLTTIGYVVSGGPFTSFGKRMDELNKTLEARYKASEQYLSDMGTRAIQSAAGQTARLTNTIAPTGKKDIDAVKNNLKKLGEEWGKTRRDLQTDISKAGLDEFDQKVLEITNKAEDMKQKFKNIPGTISEINTWLQKMTEQVQWEKQWKEYEEYLKKREEGEKRYTALANELETSTADERLNRIQKSIQEETKLTQELLEIWQTTEMSYEEYQNRLTEIEEKGAREREKINEDYNLAILESESRRRLAILDMAEKEMFLSKTDITKGRIAEYQKLLTYYESIRDRAIEIGDITARIQAEDKISDINTHLNELNLTLTELTGTFAEGALRGFNEFLYNLNSTFQTAKEIAKETAEAMEQAFTDFFFDAFDAKLKDLSDYIESFSKSVRRAIASALGQQVSGAIIGGISGLFGATGATGASNAAAYESFGKTFSFLAPAHHKGGVIGHDNPTFYRIVSNFAFAHAPRHHTGLASDEYAAILQKGESIFTKNQMKALGLMARGASPMNVKVELKNESGTRLEIDENPDVKFDLDQLVISTVVRKVKEDKQFRNFLQTGGKS